jgi:hypothetical protein
MHKEFRVSSILISLLFAILLGMLLFRGVFIARAINSGKTLYQIDVNRLNEHETYITDNYIVDPNTKCISFKDEMKIKRIVCNNYTITEY